MVSNVDDKLGENRPLWVTSSPAGCYNPFSKPPLVWCSQRGDQMPRHFYRNYIG